MRVSSSVSSDPSGFCSQPAHVRMVRLMPAFLAQSLGRVLHGHGAHPPVTCLRPWGPALGCWHAILLITNITPPRIMFSACMCTVGLATRLLPAGMPEVLSGHSMAMGRIDGVACLGPWGPALCFWHTFLLIIPTRALRVLLPICKCTHDQAAPDRHATLPTAFRPKSS